MRLVRLLTQAEKLSHKKCTAIYEYGLIVSINKKLKYIN